MFYVSEIISNPPSTFLNNLQPKVYEALSRLQIPFGRVDSDPALTMADCLHIDQQLKVRVVKTLFVTNRQQTDFYLVVTTSDKPFKTKDFSAALNISRVSFASPEQLETMTGAKVGAATVFGVLMDPENKFQLVIDKDVLDEEWYGCSDGTSTCYLKIKTADLMDVFLPSTNHTAKLIIL